MTFADVEAKTMFVGGFSPTDTGTIIDAMRTAYDGSPTAKAMFDNFIAVPGNEIIFKFEPGEFGVPSRVEEPGEPGFVKLDLSWLEGNTYVTPTGEKVEDTPLSAIVHELGHALGGYSDNEAYDKGHNIEFVNKIFHELDIPGQAPGTYYDGNASDIPGRATAAGTNTS